jgi:DNA polymerase-3 subunit epsilon
MKLNLKNPLIFFDLETTGVDVAADRIVEISYLKIYPNGDEESKTMKVNPTIPIPAKVIAIHGITDDDVKDAPKFSEIANSLTKVFEGSDFAGYNSNKFDLPLLAEEFIRAGTDIDLKKRKFVAYKFYCDKELKNAHSAEADTQATYEVLKAQLEKYNDLPNDIDELSKYSSHNRNVDFLGRIIYDDEEHEIFNFGKYKGQRVDEVLKKDLGYYGWMMNGQFPMHTKNVLTAIKLRAAFGK